MQTTTRTLDTGDAEIAYDVHGPLPAAAGRPPLLMIGQPMTARGFSSLASHFPDRTVVTYDPRGLGRSTRRDGDADHTPEVQAEDVHALVQALGAGPVELFASSGGAVTALALVAAHPGASTSIRTFHRLWMNSLADQAVDATLFAVGDPDQASYGFYGHPARTPSGTGCASFGWADRPARII